MSFQWPLALALHQLGTIVWIGGMFFAHVAVRPAAAQLLEPPRRLPLLAAVFHRFFPWVWMSILLLWASGFWIFLAFGGKVGPHVHAMMGIAAIMTVIFLFIWVAPYKRLQAAVAAEDWPAAGAQVALIRRLIAVNLVLGLVNAVTGAAGPHLLAAASAL